MIKFRCPCCGQKIAANIEGANTDIHCPTCVQLIVVPPATVAEFALARRPESEPVPFEVEPVNDTRNALLPHIAQWVREHFIRTLLFQRQRLIDTQNTGTAHAEELERRLAQIQLQWQRRVTNYEARISELEFQLAVRERENQELRRRQPTPPLGNPPVSRHPAVKHTNLRSAGTLVSA